MKKLIVVFVLIVLVAAFFLIGCSESADATESGTEYTSGGKEGESIFHEVDALDDDEEFGYFNVIESWRITSYGDGTAYYVKVLVDPATGVMYYHEVARGKEARSLQFVPLYNADGSLRIYEGD